MLEDSSASSRREAEELKEKRSRSDGINSAVFLFRCRLVSACVV